MCEECAAFSAKLEALRPPACNNPTLMTGACVCTTDECPRHKFWGYHTNQPAINVQKEWLEHLQKDHKPNRSHVGNGTYQGPFAFTLTKSPKDSQTVLEMIAAVRKVMTQKSQPIKKFAWYLEYKGEETHPHIHGMYETETGRRIEAKHFKRAWPLWDEKIKLGAGFRGGYHRPIKDTEKYADYIKKDGGVSESSGQE